MQTFFLMNKLTLLAPNCMKFFKVNFAWRCFILFYLIARSECFFVWELVVIIFIIVHKRMHVSYKDDVICIELIFHVELVRRTPLKSIAKCGYPYT